ncbi:cytochrome d ubiquinol oxidase subunit II [Methylophaga sp.]|jgi:cytochrome d ubiquinol oxidase subunit II|uniref:cytochrome d ubiquinol oxidase subunit II n=1 Tax=Methylophaga sp. TaxID=2024840 RepID=UPI0013FF54B6|nr:cytochrome d ubiquinol oxidase subunit II [Methylophaga sp.]MTI63529.1 cytochrome d ubiquinol oxidase subunit II [Methylophaga sp.]
MFDFSSWLDLPLIWAGLIAAAIFIYVLLDGFDLGCGILFPFAPSDKSRDTIMNSIAPFWDGNETWLVLGGGGLFAAFPLAYAILMPAFYLPVILMLLGLILRGVAFEFRFKTEGRDRKLWDLSFHVGSMLAAFMQGVILGNIVQGVDVAQRSFAGGPLDWANGFATVTGIALVFGYALIGATWLIWKTENDTQIWARRIASYVSAYVILGMLIVSVYMPLSDARIETLWFSLPNIFYLAPIPILTLAAFLLLWRTIHSSREVSPFLLTMVIFLLGYVGVLISIYPWIVPFSFTLWDAAAAATSQSLLLIGTAVLLPVILAYTAYSYYVFRGKTSDEMHY